MYFTIDSGHKIAKCQNNKNGTLEHGTVGLFASFGLTKKMPSPEAGKVHGFQADRMIDRYPGSF